MNTYYPLMLQMAERNCLLVGGGRAAEHKAQALWESGAQLHVVSPNLTQRLRKMASAGRFVWVQREYAPADMAHKHLAIAATGKREVDEAVLADARRAGILAASAADPDQGDFIVPASLRRGRLTLTVSTAGASPLLAGQIRQELQDRYDPDYEIYLDVLHDFRQRVKDSIREASDRRVLLAAVLQLDWRACLAQGCLREACDRLLEEWKGSTR